MEVLILIYIIIFVFPPLSIAASREQPGWAIFLNFITSTLIVPGLILYGIVGAAFGSTDEIILALLFSFLPYFLAFIIDGKNTNKKENDNDQSHTE